jgi:hypothetical protein
MAGQPAAMQCHQLQEAAWARLYLSQTSMRRLVTSHAAWWRPCLGSKQLLPLTSTPSGALWQQWQVAQRYLPAAMVCSLAGCLVLVTECSC